MASFFISIMKSIRILRDCIQGVYKDGHIQKSVTKDVLTYQVAYAANKANDSTNGRPRTITQSSTVQGNTHMGVYSSNEPPTITNTYAEVIPEASKRYSPTYEDLSTHEGCIKSRPTSIRLTSTTVNTAFNDGCCLVLRGYTLDNTLVYSNSVDIPINFATTTNTTVTLSVDISTYADFWVFELYCEDGYSSKTAKTLKLICTIDQVSWELEKGMRSVGEFISAGLPDHLHILEITKSCCGADPGTKTKKCFCNGDWASTDVTAPSVSSASDTDKIYGYSDTVTPKSICSVYLIKY